MLRRPPTIWERAIAVLWHEEKTSPFSTVRGDPTWIAVTVAALVMILLLACTTR